MQIKPFNFETVTEKCDRLVKEANSNIESLKEYFKILSIQREQLVVQLLLKRAIRLCGNEAVSKILQDKLTMLENSDFDSFKKELVR